MSETANISVLHVDDEPDFADLAADMLEREDDRFTVATATSASEGLERLAADNFDCIVSDYDMPGQNGIEFLGQVRDEYPDLPFILFTGKGSEDVASEAISAGVTDYLQKDSGTEQYELLANRIRNAVERAQAQRDRRRHLNAIETAREGISILDDDGAFVYVNEAYADLYGYDPEDLLGEHWAMLYRDDDVQRIQDEILPTVEAEGYWRGETTGVRADGSTFVEDHMLALTDTGEFICTVRDITERKERIQQVERERDRFVAIFEAVPEPIVHVRFEDEQPIVKNINSAFTDTFGYDPTDIEGESINDAIVPDEHIDEARQIDASVQDRGTVEREVERVAADGRRPFLFRSNRFEVADDTMESIGVYIDLTEQKQREQQLEFERDRLESLFTAIPEPAVEVEFTDDGPLLRDVNEAFETTFGYDAAAVRGEDINDLIVPDDPEVRAEAEAIDERASAGEQLTREVQRETSDGLRDFLFRSAPIGHEQDSETPQQFGLYIDITERKERERALEHLQQRTQELMHTATNEETAQVAVEAAHDVVDVPLSGCHLVDDEQRRLEPTAVVDTVREEIGDPPAYERTVDDAPAAEVVWQAFEDGEPLVIDDTREYGRLAEVTPARSAIIYPLDDYGVFIVSATEPNAFDDTDTTLTEIIATSLKTALERVDREQTLERQNDRLNEFTSIVSHDLRNPLSVAQGHLDLAREACDSEHLDDVAWAHDRMETLLDDLLTLARHGERVEERETVELADLTDACWRTVATADATLVTETTQTIRADPSRLKQLLENLFRNAVEHAGEDITVTVGDLDAGFYIADDGSGIPAEERDAVFEAGHSTVDDGTGFGLNIVQEIAEAHGWEISVTDSKNGGARFEITGVETAAA